MNHQDSETLFHRVWSHMSSLEQYEAIIEGYGQASMQWTVPCQDAHLMLITSDHPLSVIKRLMDQFLMEMKVSTLDHDNDGDHCQILMHCQEVTDKVDLKFCHTCGKTLAQPILAHLACEDIRVKFSHALNLELQDGQMSDRYVQHRIVQCLTAPLLIDVFNIDEHDHLTFAIWLYQQLDSEMADLIDTMAEMIEQAQSTV